METEVNEQMKRSREDLLALKKNLETLRVDVAALLATLRDTAKSQVIQAKQRLWESSKTLEGEAQSRLDSTFEKIKERGMQARARTLENVEHRPLTSLAVSFVAGYLLASLMRRH
ncbi:MAG: hypothetical protein NTZ09_15785 [Candidatus Hydrogenedentes bacterium]|nr:hypothetical protein [Candidatus Hydrogenedentota bacterium]